MQSGWLSCLPNLTRISICSPNTNANINNGTKTAPSLQLAGANHPETTELPGRCRSTATARHDQGAALQKPPTGRGQPDETRQACPSVPVARHGCASQSPHPPPSLAVAARPRATFLDPSLVKGDAQRRNRTTRHLATFTARPHGNQVAAGHNGSCKM